MKRFIGEIKVEEPILISDICKALENYPDSGRKYEIEMHENVRDRMACSDIPAVLKIFEVIEA